MPTRMKIWSFDGPRNVHLCMAALQMLHCNIRFLANEGVGAGQPPTIPTRQSFGRRPGGTGRVKLPFSGDSYSG